MKVSTIIIDEFEYKGRKINVHKDGNEKIYFVYKEQDKNIIISLNSLREFINTPHTHTLINNNKIDIIEKSVKINNFIYNLEDLKRRINKYL